MFSEMVSRKPSIARCLWVLETGLSTHMNNEQEVMIINSGWFRLLQA